MWAVSSSVNSRWVRAAIRPIFRASMKSISSSTVAMLAVATASGEEPEAGGYLGGVEQLPRQCDHAVHEVGLDEVLSDLPLAGLVRGHRAVGEHEPSNAAGGEVV